MIKKSIFADLSLLFVAFIWGVTFVVVQNAISFLPPNTFNGIRFFMAALLLGGWLFLFERNQLKYFNKKLLLAGIVLGIWLFLGYSTQTIGLLYTSSSKAGFITGLSVVLVPLFSFIILRHRLGGNAIFGVALATFGLYLLTMTDISAINKGDVLVFICAVGFAMQIVFTGKYSKFFPTLLLTVVQISTVSVLSFIYAFFFENWNMALQPSVLFKLEVFAALVITSVFATALAFFIQTNFQKFTTPTRVALIFTMEPVFAAAAGIFINHEQLSSLALIGCFFIFAGMIFAEIPLKKLVYFRKKERSI